MGASSSVILSNAIPSNLSEHEKVSIKKSLEEKLAILQSEGKNEQNIQNDLNEHLQRKLDEAKKRADEDTTTPSFRAKLSAKKRAKSVNFTMSDRSELKLDSDKSAYTDDTDADQQENVEIARTFDEKVDIDDVLRQNTLLNRSKGPNKSRRWSSVTFQGELPSTGGRKKSIVRKMSAAFMKHADTFVSAEYVTDNNIEMHKSIHSGASFSLGSVKSSKYTDHSDASDFATNTINEEDEHAAKSLAATLAVIKSVGKLRKKSANNVRADESLFNIATEVPTNSNQSNSQNGNGSSTVPAPKSDQTSPSLVTQTSNNFAQELLDTQMETIANFMLKHKADMAIEESTQIFDVYSNPFRVRRLTFEQEFVHQEKSKADDAPVEVKNPASEPLGTKLNVYSASEMDGYVQTGLSNGEGEIIESMQHAPFPEEYVGTFSCHGMEPKASAGDPDDARLCGKINQDRGCVVYPLRYEYQDVPKDAMQGARKRRGSVAVAAEDYLFMVLDGHGGNGALVSEFAMRHIVLSLPKHPMLFTSPHTALTECILDAHASLFNSDINCTTSGTTCVLAYMSKNKLYIANVGDSRAVMGMYPDEASTKTKESNKSSSTGGDEEQEDYLNIDSMDLSRDHKPDEPLEKERIIRSGGFIKPARFGQSARVYLDSAMTMVGIATSRTIGDFAVKSVGVVAEPEILEYTLTPQHKFMILASDGVWEFLSSQEACDIVNMFIDEGATAACQELIAAAMSKWESLEGDYRDDITAIVVSLPLPGSAQA